jgi:hypothetical protein
MTWLAHVKKTMKAESGKKGSMGKRWFSHVLKSAKRTYKKGGADPEPNATNVPDNAPVGENTANKPDEGGRRKRRGMKTRRRPRKH